MYSLFLQCHYLLYVCIKLVCTNRAFHVECQALGCPIVLSNVSCRPCNPLSATLIDKLEKLPVLEGLCAVFESVWYEGIQTCRRYQVVVAWLWWDCGHNLSLMLSQSYNCKTGITAVWLVAGVFAQGPDQTLSPQLPVPHDSDWRQGLLSQLQSDQLPAGAAGAGGP